jgi:hypothetical protein
MVWGMCRCGLNSYGLGMCGCGLNSYGLGHMWMWTEFIWFGACMDVG